jgi:hypothetical protein
MALFKVESAPGAPVPRFNGIDAYVVQANNSTEAKALAKGAVNGDSDAVWDAATVTDLSTAGPVALTGWVFAIGINTASPIAVSVTGDSDDTLDDVGAKLVTALNATVINAAAYNTGTNVLTVAAVADGIGDKTVTITVTPPEGVYATGGFVQGNLVASKTDGGIAAADLRVTFSTSWVVPGRLTGYKQ